MYRKWNEGEDEKQWDTGTGTPFIKLHRKVKFLGKIEPDTSN